MRNKGHFLIIGLILLLNLLWLPVLSAQKNHTGSKPAVRAFSSLASYQHPPVPRTTPSPVTGLSTGYYLLLDADTNKILVAQNTGQRIFPASVTKLATALTSLNVYPLDEVITVSQEYKEGKIMELQVGEKITVRSLVSALLIHSANDAAYNLASHHPGGIDGFVKEMNQVASKNGLKFTHFTNYDGIHNDGHYSTLYDMSQLARAAIKNETIRETVKLPVLIVADTADTIRHQLVTTNELLGVAPEIEGLKTGWTPEAGGCFVGLINLNGHKLITVVAQSYDRFGDTAKLIDWAKQNVTWAPYTP